MKIFTTHSCSYICPFLIFIVDERDPQSNSKKIIQRVWAVQELVVVVVVVVVDVKTCVLGLFRNRMCYQHEAMGKSCTELQRGNFQNSLHCVMIDPWSSDTWETGNHCRNLRINISGLFFLWLMDVLRIFSWLSVPTFTQIFYKNSSYCKWFVCILWRTTSQLKSNADRWQRETVYNIRFAIELKPEVELRCQITNNCCAVCVRDISEWLS
jgi:hypothetical protein